MQTQTEFSVGEITVINVGDGRLLFRAREDNAPLQGEHRIIDGRQTEYTLAQFKDGKQTRHYSSNVGNYVEVSHV